MKKLTFLVALVILSFSLFSQELDNEFYFRFGYSSPSWKQLGSTQAEWKNSGYSYKMGGSFEIGNIFMIKKFSAEKNMAVGIDVDYIYMDYNQFYQDMNFANENFANLRFGSKIGPSFSYSPVDKLTFDVYLKANIAMVSAAIFYVDSPDNDNDVYIAKPTVGTSTGLNVRYGILMLGIEFEKVCPELENHDNPGEFLGNSNDSQSTKSSLPCVNFTLGLSF